MRAIFPLPSLVLAAAVLGLVAAIPQRASAQAAGEQRDSGVEDKQVPNRFWQASLPGGKYMVALGSISSIGIHEYVANGTARVYEVTVSANGPALARFYYLEPITDNSPLNVGQIVADRLKNAADDLGDRTGLGDAWKKVVKDYPNTTHAHTIEFRLEYKDDLQALYASVRLAWETGKGRLFSIVNTTE